MSMVLVLGGTYVAYGWLAHSAAFWDAQSIWSIGLIIGWGVVAIEYYRQGWMIHHARTLVNVDALLPSTIFVMECILFVKGVFFDDWSMVVSALIVNSGIAFYLYQIIMIKRNPTLSK